MFSQGSLRVTRIVEQEGWGSFAAELFPQFDPACIASLDWLVPALRNVPGRGVQLYTSFHSWLVDTGRLKILIDPCAGNGRNRPNNPRFHQLDTPWLDRLRAAGAAPCDIDLVICTHLHCDHCGWNTWWQGGRWQPTFPNARYVWSRREHESAAARSGQVDPDKGSFEDSVQPVIDAGLLDLVDGTAEVSPGVVIEPAHGHTEGHCIVTVTCGDATLLFSGDVFHHPIQIAVPSWNSRHCRMGTIARETRRRLLDRVADRDIHLFAAHFHALSFGRVKRQSAWFAFHSGSEHVGGRDDPTSMT